MLTIILRLLHVVGGAVWVGSVFINAFFLFPAVLASGPGGGAVMRQIAGVRKMPLMLMFVGLVTVLSGLTLYARNSMGAVNNWGGTPAGITFGTGGLIAVIALFYGMFRTRPLADKMMAVGAQLQGAGAPPPANLVAEMAQLQQALHKATTTVAVLLIGATIAMSIARYV